MYTKIRTIKSLLNVNWYGSIDQVFLPLDTRWHNESEYRGPLSAASTMKQLYRLIREGTDGMFDILSPGICLLHSYKKRMIVFLGMKGDTAEKAVRLPVKASP